MVSDFTCLSRKASDLFINEDLNEHDCRGKKPHKWCY